MIFTKKIRYFYSEAALAKLNAITGRKKANFFPPITVKITTISRSLIKVKVKPTLGGTAFMLTLFAVSVVPVLISNANTEDKLVLTLLNTICATIICFLLVIQPVIDQARWIKRKLEE